MNDRTSRHGRPVSRRALGIGLWVCGISLAFADLPAGAVLHLAFDAAAPADKIPDVSGSVFGVGAGLEWTASGRKGGGMEFAATGSHLRVPHSPALSSPAFTLCAFIRVAGSDPVRRTIFEKDGEQGYALQILGGDPAAGQGKLAFTVRGQTCASDAIVADRTWRHVAATYDGETLRVFVDGQEQKQTAALKSAAFPGTGELTLGMNRSSPKPMEKDRSLNGRVDEVLVFSRALSAEEIRAVIADAPARFPRQQIQRSLNEIKDLYDRGLLLPDFYERKVKEYEENL